LDELLGLFSCDWNLDDKIVDVNWHRYLLIALMSDLLDVFSTGADELVCECKLVAILRNQ